MATIAANTYSSPKNINLRKGILRFDESKSSNPLSNDSTGWGLYVDSSDQLVFWDGTSTTVIGGSGGGAVSTWETIFGADNTFTINPDATFTIAGNRATATDVVTLTNIGGGSGDVLKIQNTGTGADISGTDDTWTVTKAGAATFVGITPGGDITSTGTAIDWDLQDNVASALSFDVAGVAGMLEFVTTNGSEAVKTAAGTFEVTDGILDSISTSNTVSALRVTNNTATTFGADANSAGVAVFRSTSLTTGSLVQLQLTEGTLAGGYYLTCRDVTAGANIFTIGEDGAVTIAGSAAGTDALTLTAGDILLTAGHFDMTVGDMTLADGSITVTDADNAPSLSVTNNTATTSDVVLISGSGTFTGVDASAFVAITQSGLTTGDAMSITTDAMTSGTALKLDSSGTIVTTGRMLEVIADSATTSTGLVSVSADGLTTGVALLVDSLSNEAMTSGALAQFTHTASGTTVAAKTGALVDITSSITESGTSTQDFDVVSLKRTSIHDTAGTLTAQGAVLKIENVATETGATLTDTVNGIEIVMDADGDGDAINITHNSAAGRLLDLTSSATTLDGVVQITANSVNSGNAAVIDANGLTTGTALELSSTGTIVTTGDVLSVVANSATTSTGLVRVSGTGLTDGFAMLLTGGGSNVTSSGGVLDVTGGAATDGAMLRVATTGVYQGSVGVVDINASSADTGDIVVIDGTGLTTGSALRINTTTATLTSGFYIECNDGAASDFTVADDGATTIAGSAALTAALTITAGDIVQSDGTFQGGADTGVTANVGSSQATGEAITNYYTEIATCANAGDAVTLPAAAAGRVHIITNRGAQSADVFPAASDNINETGADAAVAIAANASRIFIGIDGTHWESFILARS